MPSSLRRNNKFQKALRLLGKTGSALRFIPWLALTTWIFGIIWFNGPLPGAGNPMLSTVWLSAVAGVPFLIRAKTSKRLFVVAMFLLPLIPYLLIRPSHDRRWATDYTRTAYADVAGDILTIHHFRSFDYDEQGLPIAGWSTREYDLKNLRGMDFFMSSWGIKYVGHPIFSFDFGDQGHLAFTIEARREIGEQYSLLAGLYKRYELSYIPCEESDAVRVRTNFRENENVHLYRTVATPVQARARLLEFIATMDEIKIRPRFYNVVSSNCTTAVRSQMTGGFPFDWRIIVNGKLDEMLYERGLLETGGRSFPELKQLGHINPKVREHPDKEGFSDRIREGMPTFE